MTRETGKRDFFISFNLADEQHARAINAALRDAGYTTFFSPDDIAHGRSIMGWMRDTLPLANQVLGLCSPDYFKPEAEYSELERIVTQWGDPLGLKGRLVYVEIKPCDYGPFDDHIKRVTATSGQLPDAAAGTLLDELHGADEAARREELRRAGALPAIHNFRRPRTQTFRGRDKALADLHQSLQQGNATAVTQAIAGMGGVGKTTLASEYVHRFATAGRYAGVWWVPAENESELVASLAGLAERLGQPAGNDLPGAARWAVDHLTAATDPWLVVFDNVPSPASLQWRTADGQTGTWVPGGQSRVILTSRWSDFGDLAQMAPLATWDAETTADYLIERTGRTDTDGAQALAERLDGLPLAAEQAAAFLREEKGASFADYADDLANLIDEASADGAFTLYEQTVYATMVKSIETLDPVAQDLLCLLSWLSPDGVELRDWVEQDPDNRHFGPPSYFADKPELLAQVQAAMGVDE